MCKSILSENLSEEAPILEMLYRSPNGSLSFCPECRTFGVTFGCLHLSLDCDAVLALEMLLDKLSASRLKAGQRHRLRLGNTPATLFLSRRELSDLQRIILQGRQTALVNRASVESVDALPSEAWVH